MFVDIKAMYVELAITLETSMKLTRPSIKKESNVVKKTEADVPLVICNFIFDFHNITNSGAFWMTTK